MLINTEDERAMSQECFKVVDYCKEKGDNNRSNQKCLVECNNVINTKSCVDFSALSFSNLTPINFFERSHNILNNIPYCCLTQYCRSSTAVDIAKKHYLLPIPAGINIFLSSKSQRNQ
jgi:hypothetical protein